MTKLEAEWLGTSATRSVFRMLGDAGYPAFAVGGCVRNTLLGRPVKDIDLATSALPEVVMDLGRKSGFQAIGTGIEHGTVTVVVEGEAYEITTFRRDVETDGRRAVVAFSDNIEDDARRRDFTMNALYADADGVISDPLCGLRDLLARRVRFIEDPGDRIREDHLRSLRYFRFHALYGDPDDGFDADALDAIARNIDGVQHLSRERIGTELLLILEAPDPAQAMAGMRSTGLLAAVLPGASDTAIGPLVHLEQMVGLAPDAIRRLAVVGGEDPKDRLRLSRKQGDRLRVLKESAGMGPAELGYRLGEETARDVCLVAWASSGTTIDDAALSGAARGSRQTFPIEAADLMPDLEGPELGQTLRRLEQAWLDSDFALSREDLLHPKG